MNTYDHLRNLTLLLCTFLLLAVTGCDKDEAAPEYTINDFVGSWKASSFIQTSNADCLGHLPGHFDRLKGDLMKARPVDF